MCARRPHRQSQACRSNALYLTLEDLNFRELILPFHTSQRAKTAHMEPTKALDAAPINCSSLAAAHESANSNCAVHICLKSDPAFIRGVLLFSSERCTGCCSLLRDFTAGWDACSEGWCWGTRVQPWIPAWSTSGIVRWDRALSVCWCWAWNEKQPLCWHAQAMCGTEPAVRGLMWYGISRD